MAENEVLRRRVVPEDEVYRQVFDAEVSYAWISCTLLRFSRVILAIFICTSICLVRSCLSSSI